MKEIKTFVGHSFTAADAEVVRKFTDYFDALARSHPQFSWEHAESAEPRILTEKVLRIIADKNTFIGICTRKEHVAQPANLLPVFLRSEFWKIKKADVAWKTSDWIIQEIGLAIGKGLNVILLVESGIRDPGGLQGDIEYIPFQREKPEQAFGKILEMLSALSPRAPGQLPAVSEDPQPKEEVPPLPAGAKIDAAPDPSWPRETYEIAIFRAVGSRDEERITELTKAYKATTHGSEPRNAASWDILIEFFRLYIGKGGKLERLKDLVERNPSGGAFRYLARAYGFFDQHGLSAATYMRAVAETEDLKDKAQHLSGAIEQYAKCNLAAKTSELLSELRTLVEKTPAAEITLLKTLLELAEDKKDQNSQLALLERLVELQPDDHNARFNLAYKHSEQGRNELAAYHYLMIPEAERSSMAWNNLGAALDQIDMPAKAVNAYATASEMGETLAMSNLGHKLMGAGFVKEAKEECEKALRLQDPHKNVGQLLTTLQSLPEKENARQKEVIDAGKRRVVFLQQLGAAVAAEEPDMLANTWQGPECPLRLTKTGPHISLSGSFERDNPFAKFGIFGSLPSGADAKMKYVVTYSGEQRGRAVFGFVTRGKEGAPAFDAGTSTQQALMFFSTDKSELHVMSNADTDSPTYERLRMLQLVQKGPD